MTYSQARAGAERIIPSYTCLCGWHGVGLASERDQHMTGDHFAPPDGHPTLRLECSVDDCEQNGCNLTDCLAWVQDNGTCPSYGSPARIYTLPPVKGVD